jgi:excinuclease ABC subunit A
MSNLQNRKTASLPNIRIVGARQHNLKNLNLEIPQNRITVVTGVSGSGKSSLAFDTLYAEGQRRYVETFSPYARQFMDRMDRPLVDQIDNIPPAIAIDRKDPVRTSRSTVGTMTELTDYVKLLYTRLGQLHCRRCGRPVSAETPGYIWGQLQAFPSGEEMIIAFPVSTRGIPPRQMQTDLRRMGFDRMLHGEKILPLDQWQSEDEQGEIHIVSDRVLFRHADRTRIMDSLEQAFRFGGGRLRLRINPDRTLDFSNRLECASCHINYKGPNPNLFSFNSPVGACDTCRGFGRIIDMDPDLIIPDPSFSLIQGAIKPWGDLEQARMEFHDLAIFCKKKGIPMDRPFKLLTRTQQRAIIQGDDDFYGIRGFFQWLETKRYKMHVRVFLSRYRSYLPCPACHGTRFTPEALLYRLGGMHIGQVYALDIKEASRFFKSLPIPNIDKAAHQILGEIQNRLQYLLDVGVGYLTLDRQSRTLSGGEVQRVALTSALGSSLANSLYVLDEPSIGLHPRDGRRLIRILQCLRDLENTIIVVEHDPEIIAHSDMMLDLGPGAGEHGGEITYFGPTASVNGSLTGQYLRGKRHIAVPQKRRSAKNGKWLTILGASENNLRHVDIRIPLGLFNCLTGVSGSGKSTLVEDILYKGVKRSKGDPQGHPGHYKAIKGLDRIEDIILVDQRPIGRTPRANILTYTKAMDPIRDLLSKTDKARAKRLKKGYFSFNTVGGRCETCQGVGYEKVEMQFLSDVFITCPVCKGMRFKKHTLDITYRHKNIHDFFSMTVNQALTFFHDQPKIIHALTPLSEVGLGYIRLGQSLNTLSNGEAQRLKLSQYITSIKRGDTLFLFDEPTTGLHFEDIRKLLDVFQRLVDQGHTLLVIEHNMDVVKSADWVIDLGPEGGDEGGRLVVAGTPEEVSMCFESHTGRFLKKYLHTHRRLRTSPKKPKSELQKTVNTSIDTASVIHISGAREHNLKELSVSIPRQKLVAVTGVSGSGKSTLVFDVLFAEGQRRYLESLAPYVRQYIKILERPDVDRIHGIPPTVAIQQRISYSGRRSTVATLTEIYHFLRLLYSKIGSTHCPRCNRPLIVHHPEGIRDQIQMRYKKEKVWILAPKVAGRKGFHKDVLSRALEKGYTKARVDGAFATIRQGMALQRFHEHTIEIVMGRLPHKNPDRLIAEALLEGNGTVMVLNSKGREEVFSVKGICPSCGIGVPDPDPRLFSFNSKYGACPVCNGLGELGEMDKPRICPKCMGSRLKPQALTVMIKDQSIWDMVQRPIENLLKIFQESSFSRSEAVIATPIVSEITARLSFLRQLGLSYLTLSRSGHTLSGGEAQRIRLAAQLGSNMTGACYILDEPTIGLHPRDNRRLLDALRDLKARGNSVVVVEHDEETIREADHIIDLGPGAGQRGGNILAAGTLKALKKVPESITGASFNGRSHVITSRLRPYQTFPHIRIQKASEHSLKAIDVDLPLGTFICVTGVSGSGKSTLLKDTVYQAVRNRLLGKHDPEGKCKSIKGWENITRVLEVDHSPIGRTSRSVPASYVGFLTEIRQFFSMTPQARARGYGPGRFSFNVSEGRCNACKGQGSLKVEMSFLPDVHIHCEACEGRRFHQETLDITYKGKNISEVLELTFDEASDFFTSIPSIRRSIQVVCDIGLGYLHLGQPSPTLSGGEAQRIKLAKELAKSSKPGTLYILDEPTTGLHVADVQSLIHVLQNLVDQGNTVAVIEHNMEIIKEADYIIDLGPEGGDQGGHVVVTGSPPEILAHTNGSYTAKYLKRYIKP